MGGGDDPGRLLPREARANASMLALLVMCGAAVDLLLERTAAPRTVVIAGLLAFGLGLAVLLILLATRRAPRAGLAFGLSLALVAQYLVVLPLCAIAWQRAGRPWEAMVDLHFASTAVALALPGSFALGAATLGAFAVEAIAIHRLLLHLGVARTDLVAGEPALSLVFIVIGLAVLFVRRQRRALTDQHLHRSAEALTLARLSKILESITTELKEAAAPLGSALDRLRDRGSTAPVARIERALGKIGGVGNDLQAAEAARPTTLAPEAEERAFYARDAHNSTLILAVVILIVETLALIATRNLPVAGMRLFFLASAALAATSVAVLLAVRDRPSERLAFFIFLVNVLPAFAQYWFAAPEWARTGQAFDPLAGNKTFLVLVPLIVPRRMWVGIAIEVAMTALSITSYFFHHYQAARVHSPLAEPWTTALYLLFGLALLAARDSRRVASVQRLRSDRELQAMLSKARASITLLDKLGSPLQVLSFSIAQLEHQGASAEALQEMQTALARMSAALERVPAADARALMLLGVSL